MPYRLKKTRLKQLAEARAKRKYSNRAGATGGAGDEQSASSESTDPTEEPRSIPATDSMPMSSTAPDPTTRSASRGKIELLKKRVKRTGPTGATQTMTICDVRQLTKLLEGALCSNCFQEGFTVTVCEGENMGFASKLSMQCKHCSSSSSVMSSPTVDGTGKGKTAFDVNRRMTRFSHLAGGGFSTLQKFGAALGMPAMNQKSFYSLDKGMTAAEIEPGKEDLEHAATFT